jgi:hypothetical protein
MNVRQNSANWSEWDGEGGGASGRTMRTKVISDAALILKD